MTKIKEKSPLTSVMWAINKRKLSNKCFVQIKKMSAFQSPSGQTSYAPIPVFRCVECKTINSEFTH